MNGVKLVKKEWRNWPYKNTTYLILSLIVFFYFLEDGFVQSIIKEIGNFGYLGALITGIFFVSAFTIAPAVVVLYDLAEVLNPFYLAVFAGIGAVVGDWLIFRFLRERIFEELAPIFNKLGGSWIKKLFYTPYFIWLLSFLGAFIIASPMPDEIGISLLGLSQIKNWQFLAVSFLLNASGIFFLIIVVRSF